MAVCSGIRALLWMEFVGIHAGVKSEAVAYSSRSSCAQRYTRVSLGDVAVIGFSVLGPGLAPYFWMPLCG
jgi:hypothetical protein